MRLSLALSARSRSPQTRGDVHYVVTEYGVAYLDEKTNLTEVAFVVRNDWQNKGIGNFLLKHLSTIARRNGISGFTAEVLRANRAMQRVFQKSEFKVTSTPSEDVFSFEIVF